MDVVEQMMPRIRMVMQAGNTGLVKALAGQMPDDYKTISSTIIALADNPFSLLDFARATGANDFTRQMAAEALASVARQNVDNARLIIPTLVQVQQLNEAQTQALRDTVAWRLMGSDNMDEQARWCDDVIVRSQSIPLMERRVRMARTNGDRRGLTSADGGQSEGRMALLAGRPAGGARPRGGSENYPAQPDETARVLPDGCRTTAG